jgi:hypothetical protein
MIQQTLFLSFDEPLTGDDVVKALSGIEAAITQTGLTQTLAVRAHRPVPGEENIPAFIGSAILQISLTDLDTFGELFAAEEVTQSFDDLREQHPYRAAWVNHEPLR